MDFEIPEEFRLIRETAKDFVKRRLIPLERDLLDSENGTLSKELIEELKKNAKEIGFFGLRVPVEFGGLGSSILCLCLVEEELAKTIIPFNFGDVTPILFHCNDDQKKKYLNPVIEGEKQYSIALLEPEESRLTSLKTTAIKENDHYILKGRKLIMQYLNIGDFFITFAVTDPEKKLGEGVTCFLVDKDKQGLVIPKENEEAQKTPFATPIIIEFDQCKVSVKNILGEIGKAFQLGANWLPIRRIIRGARCVGVARRLLEICSDYAKGWEIFGRTISEQPKIQRFLAEMAADIQAARLMVYHAAWMADNGKDILRQSSMAKAFATEMLHRTIDKTVQIHGGPGFYKGLFFDRLYRNNIVSSLMEETLELQKTIIARDILRGLSF